MFRRFARAAVTLAGMVAGPGIVAMFYQIFQALNWFNPYTLLLPAVNLSIFAVSALLFGAIFYILSPGWLTGWARFAGALERHLRQVPAADIFAGAIGLIIGLMIAFFLTNIVRMIPITWVQIVLSVMLYALLAYLGTNLSVSRYEEVVAVLRRWSRLDAAAGVDHPAAGAVAPKVLDTSVIIDGRIFDIVKAGFLEGTLIIPGFVLTELRHIADSSDPMRRGRGRRGLDVLRRLREELGVTVAVDEQDYEDISEVDQKLLRLAAEKGAKVLTNDFNLNKVAAVQGVAVLNINELSLATKAPLLPGEELPAQIVKEGKEPNQGVAYLEDGTMIVVENGSAHMGEWVSLSVTSVIQTSAGRMIFARIKATEQVHAI